MNKANHIEDGNRTPDKFRQDMLLGSEHYITKSDLEAFGKQIAGLTGLPPRKSVNVKEAAAMIGVCEESVRRLVRRKLLKKANAFRTILIPIEEIDIFLGETKSI